MVSTTLQYQHVVCCTYFMYIVPASQADQKHNAERKERITQMFPFCINE